ALRARVRENCNSLMRKNSLRRRRWYRAEEGDESPNAVLQVLDRDPLVAPVDRLLLLLREDERNEAVAGDPLLAEVVAVGEARDDARNDRHPAQIGSRQLADRGDERRVRIRGRGGEGEERLDADGVVADHAAQLGDEGGRTLAGKEPAVELSARFGRDDVRFQAALQDGGGDGVADERVLPWISREIRQELRFLECVAHVGQLAAERFLLEWCECGEVALHGGNEADGGLVAPDLVERPDQTGHGGEAGRCRSVPGLSMCHDLEPARRLLRHRHLYDLLPAAQVDVVPLREQVLRVAEQVPTVVHEPSRPRATPGLLVGRRKGDDV